MSEEVVVTRPQAEDGRVTEKTDVEAPKPIKYEYTIAGKQVVMRRRVPNKDASRLFTYVNKAISLDDTDDIVPLGRILIESWEFAGSPQKTESYGALEYFDEVLPLGQALAEYVNARMTAARAVPN